jgi:hypothetical protein
LAASRFDALQKSTTAATSNFDAALYVEHHNDLTQVTDDWARHPGAAPTVVPRLGASRFDTLQKPTAVAKGHMNVQTAATVDEGEVWGVASPVTEAERGIGVPEDFNARMYKLLHEDLASHTDEDARLHYEQSGKAEGRTYKGPTKMLDEAWAFTRDDWARHPGANQSGVHFTCMSVFQRMAQPINTTGVMVEAIESFMSTTRADSNLWVVDDASTCKLHLQAIRLLEKKHSPRLHVHIKTANGGIARSKNSCIRMFLDSNAQYLSLVDQDVYFVKEGWQEAYEAGLDCGVDHMQHNLNPPAPGTTYGLKCPPDAARQSPFPWWISHVTESNSLSLAKNEHETFDEHRTRFLQESGGVALLHDLTTVGSFGYFYTFNRRLIVLLGGYHVFQHKWGHEHTEYHSRARVVTRLLDILSNGSRAPLLRVPAILDIPDSSAYIGCHIFNGGAFDSELKQEMAGSNGKEMGELLQATKKGSFHSAILE